MEGRVRREGGKRGEKKGGSKDGKEDEEKRRGGRRRGGWIKLCGREMSIIMNNERKGKKNTRNRSEI